MLPMQCNPTELILLCLCLHCISQYFWSNMTCWAAQGFKTRRQWRLLFQWMGPATGQGSVEAAALLRVSWMEDIKKHRNISRDTIPAHEYQKGAHVSRLSLPVIHIPAAAAGQRTSVYRVVPGSTAPRLPELASHLRARVYSELSVNCPHNICFPPQPRPGSCVSTLFCGEKCSSW